MRLEASYRIKMNLSLLDYRMQVLSLIKESIKISDEQYYEKLFVQSENQMQDFVFSVYFHQFSMQPDDRISLERMSITISSASIETFTHIFNGIRKIKEYRVGEGGWEQTNVQLLKEIEIRSSKVIFKTMSPILLEDKNHHPLTPSDRQYEQELNYYSNLQMQNIQGRNLYKPLRFTPIQMKKKVIKFRHRHLKEKEILYFTTFSGSFLLEGDPEDLSILFKAGIGKRSTYMGMIAIVKEVM